MTDTATPRISEQERQILVFLNQEDGAYQFNTWALPPELSAHLLPNLKRRGLVDAEGRGNGRQWWITDTGKEALA